jgi:hypothetical protein
MDSAAWNIGLPPPMVQADVLHSKKFGLCYQENGSQDVANLF